MPRSGSLTDPIVPKLRDGLLERIRQRLPSVGDHLDCASPDDQLRDTVEQLRPEIEDYIRDTLKMKRGLSVQVKQQIRDSIFDEIFGFGPLGMLLRRPDVGNIYVEGAERVFFERYKSGGQRSLEKKRLPFRDDDHVLDIIYRVITPLGLDMNELTPLVHGKLPNGSEVYASMAPVSVHGPALTLICSEGETQTNIPGWRIYHNKGEAELTVESKGAAEEAVLRINVPSPEMHVCLSQCFPARSFRGKRVRFAGVVKSSSPSAPRAAMFAWSGKKKSPTCWRAEGEVSVDGNKENEWQKFDYSLMVPPAAALLKISISLDDPGLYEVKGLGFEVLSADGVPLPRHHRVRHPVNLALQL